MPTRGRGQRSPGRSGSGSPSAALISFAAGAVGLRWPLAIAFTLALPNPSPQSLSVLTALVPLIALDRRDPLERRVWLTTPRSAVAHS